jgi:hypothetical protein
VGSRFLFSRDTSYGLPLGVTSGSLVVTDDEGVVSEVSCRRSFLFGGLAVISAAGDNDKGEALRFGESLAISEEFRLVGSASTGGGPGTVSVFHSETGEWLRSLAPSADIPTGGFGAEVAIFGGTAVVGDRNSHDDIISQNFILISSPDRIYSSMLSTWTLIAVTRANWRRMIVWRGGRVRGFPIFTSHGRLNSGQPPKKREEQEFDRRSTICRLLYSSLG